MKIKLSETGTISMGANPNFPGAITLPAIAGAPRPFGCGLMQFAAKTLALNLMQGGCGPLLLVEHDATPTEWWVEEVVIPDDADLLYLGWSKFKPIRNPGGAPGLSLDGPVVGEEKSDGIVRVQSTLATHAILYVTTRGLEWGRRANLNCMVLKKPSDIAMAESLHEVVAYGLTRPPYCQGPENNVNFKNTNFCLPV
jgi:hypothetical protein